jgi:cell division septum initiation protein DivIVA
LKKENYQLKNQNKKLQNELNHLKEQNKSILPNQISTQDFGMHL